MGFIIFRLIIFVAIVWFGLRLLKVYNLYHKKTRSNMKAFGFAVMNIKSIF